jgi:hypothetical protein
MKILQAPCLLAIAALGCHARDALPPMPPTPHAPFSVPADFDRTLCVSGALARFDPLPAGTWHLDVRFEGVTPLAGVLRVHPDGTFFNGRPSTRSFTRDDFLVRAEYRSQDQAISWTLDACAAPSGKEMTGGTARCVNDESCLVGTFRAVRLERRPGEAEALGLRKVAEVSSFPGSPPGAITANVRVRGDLAYLARFQDGLRVVDLSNLAAPAVIGHFAPQEASLGEFYNDIKLYDHYALLASSRLGMVILDVADPRAPRFVTSFPARRPNQTRVNVHSIFVEGDRAYLAEISILGMRAVSLANPAQPVDLGTFVLPEASTRFDTFVHDLTVRDGIAYLNYWGSGFVVVDLRRTPFAEIGRFTYPRPTSHASWVTEIGGRLYALHGDEDFTAHLRILDVTDASDGSWLSLVGELELRPEISIHNLMAVGARAYVAWYQDGLRVLDLSQPAQPRVVAYYNTWDPARHPGLSFYEGAIGLDVDPARNRIYVADTERGLLVLEE